MKQQLGSLISKALQTLNWQILMTSITNQLFSLSDRWKNPRFSVFISVCALSEVHLLRVLVGVKALGDLKDGVRRDVFRCTKGRVLSSGHCDIRMWKIILFGEYIKLELVGRQVEAILFLLL